MLTAFRLPPIGFRRLSVKVLSSDIDLFLGLMVLRICNSEYGNDMGNEGI